MGRTWVTEFLPSFQEVTNGRGRWITRVGGVGRWFLFFFLFFFFLLLSNELNAIALKVGASAVDQCQWIGFLSRAGLTGCCFPC